jgi:hypothetical protein
VLAGLVAFDARLSEEIRPDRIGVALKRERGALGVAADISAARFHAEGLSITGPGMEDDVCASCQGGIEADPCINARRIRALHEDLFSVRDYSSLLRPQDALMRGGPCRP